jgi:hypothetical protein
MCLEVVFGEGAGILEGVPSIFRDWLLWNLLDLQGKMFQPQYEEHLSISNSSSAFVLG